MENNYSNYDDNSNNGKNNNYILNTPYKKENEDKINNLTMNTNNHDINCSKDKDKYKYEDEDESILDLERTLNNEFCKEVGIKQAICYIVNKETGETRFYSSLSGLYKKPSGWKKIAVYKFNEPKYPDLINNPFNFTMLLNVQWEMFGELGDVYKRTGEESFEYNYIKTRLTAIKMCKSFGGGEMLELYKEAIQNILFDYIDLDDEE